MSRMGGWPLVRLGLALLGLNALLTFANLWPGIGVVPQLRVSVELALLVIVLALCVRFARGPSPRSAGVLAVIVSFGVLWRYADVTSRALLGRPVNLYWDGQHVWQLLRMAGAEQAWFALGGGVMAAVLLIGLLFLLLRTLISWTAQGLHHSPVQSALPLAALLLVLAWCIAPRLGFPVHQVFVEPVSGSVAKQVRAMARSMSPERLDASLPASPAFDRDLSVLGGSDVVVLFLEAYGAITLDDPHIRASLAPAREVLARAISRSDRSVVSARVVSPTFGGASWLAHAALLSGLDTREPDVYAGLLRSRRSSLVSHFSAHGYRTVAWVPGIQRPWPEGRFWGFDRYGELDTLGYRGPGFGYWQVPDQAAMALLERDELSVAARHGSPAPRFVMFPTVSTHAPFAPLAPLVSDWAALAAGTAYTPAEREAALAVPQDWTQPTPQYIAAFRYTLGWLAGFIAERADPDLVLIVIGDHQPIGAVTGPGAPWDVPVHVISRNTELLARLRGEGFVNGLQPPDRPLAPLQALTPLLLRVFGEPLHTGVDVPG